MFFERVPGIEPRSQAWKARVITVIRYPLIWAEDRIRTGTLRVEVSHAEPLNTTSACLSAGWDSNPRFQLPATCIDDISIQRYLPIIKKPSQFTDWVRIFNERVKTYPISIMGPPPAIAPFPMIDMLLTAFIFILILSYTNIY